MSKKIILVLAAALCCLGLSAQDYTGGVKGTVVNRADRSGIQMASLRLYKGDALVAEVLSSQDGTFLIENLDNGMYDLVISAPEFLDNRVAVTVNDGYVKNMFNLSMTPSRVIDEAQEDNLLEFDMDDSGYNDSPTVLFSQNDVFEQVASYNFSTVRFRARGYGNETQDVYVAGVRLNDAITGNSPFSLWSGLNEATRTKMSSTGLEVSDYGLGGFNGLVNIPMTASYVRKGWRGSVVTNSAFYRLRLMLTYASGPLDNGWSYAFSVSGRFGGNDWVPGVFYRSFAYYASVEKKFSEAHKLSAAFLATPGSRGMQNSSTQEVYDLVGSNFYNSNWGMQDGKVRNSRVRTTHEPIAFLKYDFTPSYKFRASATVLYRFGSNVTSAVDWYDAPNPTPDYYRNLPSYFYLEEDNPYYGGYGIDVADFKRNSPVKAEWARDAWTSGNPAYTQLNWQRLYDVNRASVNEWGQKRSKYILEHRHIHQNDLNIAANAKWNATDWFALTGGLSFRLNRSEYYKTVGDLLGGDYYLNLDNFADRDFAAIPAKVANNLDYFMRAGQVETLHVGDKYGYDYYAHVRNLEAWFNGHFEVGGLSANLGGRLGYNATWRYGLVRKGLFAGLTPEGDEILDPSGNVLTSYDPLTGEAITSFGQSKVARFLTGAAKANLSYTIGGNMRVYANVGYFSEAPTFAQTFISPRTRNSMMDGLTTVKTFASDLNWQFSSGGFNFRLTGYYTRINDKTKVMSFYNDLRSAFTNFALSGIDERHVGLEFGFRVPTPLPSLSVRGVLALGNFVYTSNPRMTMTVDNSTEIVMENELVPYWQSHPVYRKYPDGDYVTDFDGNYVQTGFQQHHVAGTPELAASLGLNWNYKYWFVELSGDYFANSYLDMNPFYRTDDVTLGTDNLITPREIEYMASQEKFDPCFMLNVSIGKSWFIQRKYNIGFSLNAKNLLNNTSVKTGGYEQTRVVDNTESDTRYYRFPAKYFYLSGFNYMLNIYFRF